METPSGFDGAVFDVNGVLVDSPHKQAWRDGLQQMNGVQAGEMAALGLAWDDDETLLEGADLVVTSLDDVALGAPSRGRLEAR